MQRHVEGHNNSGSQARLGSEQRLAIQYAIARAFADGDDVRQVARLVLGTLADALRWDAAGLWVVEADGGTLRCEEAIPLEGAMRPWVEHSLALRLRVGHGLPGRVAAEGRSIWVRDTDDESNFPRREVARQVGLRHGFAFPVRAERSVVGVVELFAADVRDIDAEQAEFLDAVGHQLGSFIRRIEAWRALTESEARKGAILQAAVDAIVSAEADGRIVEFNAAAEVLFGRRRDEVVGKMIADLLVPDDLRPAHVEGLARYLATGRARIIGRRVRTRAARRGGADVPVELTVTETTLSRGPLFTAFIRDVTRERQAETVRNRFLEILSHELRTPVTSIYGGAKVLARPSLDASRRAELLDDVGSEADRLYRLVEDLIVLATAERGPDTIVLEPVHLDRVAERVVAAARAQSPELEFRVASHGSSYPVHGDETYVEQLLRNLLSNAAKYASDGRLVELVIEHGDDESIVRILDRGPGVDGGEADRLFEIGYRSAGSQGLADGSGIGLFVARWLVEAMGGRIWASPRAGGGSEFGFALQTVGPDGDRPAGPVVALGGE